MFVEITDERLFKEIQNTEKISYNLIEPLHMLVKKKINISYHLIEPGHAGLEIWRFAIKALKLFAVTLTLLSNSYRQKSI